MHLVFSVQEEFNLRGALPAAQTLAPDIAIQIDLMLATDTPDMADRGEMRLGGGPGMSLYSFHGRGTLNGVIPHPAMVKLIEETAKARRHSAATLGSDRRADRSILCPAGRARAWPRSMSDFRCAIPIPASKSATCRIWPALTRLLVAALSRIGPDFELRPR